MPRGKKTQYALAEDGDGRLSPVPVASGSPSVSSVPRLQADADRVAEAASSFLSLMARDDGWLRCVPGGDGKVNYYKWKFSRGRHTGKYVMFVAPAGDWSGGVIGLAEKVAEVDDGVRKPAHDTFYDPR